MIIGGRKFNTTKYTYVMGILNVTPDSFSDGGRWKDKGEALRHVEEMIAGGMDILDIGGESTRPGYTQISDDEEIARVVPIIEAVKANFNIPISLDTYKSAVAAAGIAAGADLINDIWGLKYDDRMAGIIAESKVACCLMHNREKAGYQDLRRDMAEDLQETIRLAREARIDNEKIILDPGIGFAKSHEDNLMAMRHLEDLNMLGYPILLGASRKSMIGLSLGFESGKRLEGTLVTTVFAVIKGCSFVRVHDVKENAMVIRMAQDILYGIR